MSDVPDTADMAAMRTAAAKELPDVDDAIRRHQRAHARLIGGLAGAEGADVNITDLRKKVRTAEAELEEARALYRYIADARQVVNDYDLADQRAEAQRQAAEDLTAAAAKLDQAADAADKARKLATDGLEQAAQGLNAGGWRGGREMLAELQMLIRQDHSPVVGDPNRLSRTASQVRGWVND